MIYSVCKIKENKGKGNPQRHSYAISESREKYLLCFSGKNFPNQWFPKLDTRPTTSTSSGNLLERQILNHKFYLCLTSWCPLTTENHCSKHYLHLKHSELGWLWVVCKFGGWKAEYEGFSKEVKNHRLMRVCCAILLTFSMFEIFHNKILGKNNSLLTRDETSN